MAVSSEMKRGVRLIAESLGQFAKRQGWGPKDFRLFFRVNEAWDSIHVIFAAQGFADPDSFEAYSAVKNFLKDRLKNEPDLFRSVGLVVTTFDQVQQGGMYDVGRDYFQVKPKVNRDLLKRTVRLVAGALTKFSEEKQWDSRSYWIYYSVDTEVDSVRFLFEAAEFDGQEPVPVYQLVMDYLKNALSEEPDVLSSFQLRVGGKHQSDGSDRPHPGPEFKEFWTLARS